VALGVAVSARVASTRIAILIATIVFFPTAMFVTTMVGVLGEPAGDEWSLGMEGPFWWTEALTEYFFDPRIFGLLVALPLYVFLMPVWLFLASAVAGIRPPAEDRSTPFKWWSVVAVLGMLVIVGFMPLLINDPEGATVGGVVYGLMGQSLLLFIALIFMNEPPLPPRLFAQRMKESRLGFIGRAIGPGAAPTLRFATALIVVTSVGMAILPALTRHLYWPTWTRNGEGDLSLLILAAGNISVCFFFLSFGVWLRVMLRNGVAARVLAIASIMTAAILPFLFAVIVDPSSFDNLDEEIPFVIQLSPNAPSMVAGAMAAGEMHAEASLYSVLSVLMYAAFGGIFWVLVEVRCAKVQRIDEERRVKRDERARTSEPNAPLLTRGSRPSLASAIAARTEAQTRPFPPNEKAPPERSGAAGSRSGAEAQRSAGGAGSAGPFAEGAGRAEAAAPNAPAIAADWQGSTEAFELTREKDGQETLESGSKSETETESATATPTPRDFAADDADTTTEVDPEASVDDEEIEP
jgi:hypothetical protein